MYLFADHEDLWGPAPALEQAAVSLSDRWCLQALISPEDIERARQWKWCHTYGSGGRIADKATLTGAIRRGANPDKIYARRTTRDKTLWLHREVCFRRWGPPPGPAYVADHLNGDSLDCRRENLEWATLSQNAKNLFGSAWLQLRMDL